MDDVFFTLDFQERSRKKQCEIENRARLRGWQSHGMKVDLAMAGLQAPSVDCVYYSAGTQDQFVKKDSPPTLSSIIVQAFMIPVSESLLLLRLKNPHREPPAPFSVLSRLSSVTRTSFKIIFLLKS